MNDEELAIRLKEAWYQTGQPERGPLWLAFARRARELLLPVEAQAMMAAALDADPNRLHIAAVAYRAAQQPKEKYTVIEDRYPMHRWRVDEDSAQRVCDAMNAVKKLDTPPKSC